VSNDLLQQRHLRVYEACLAYNDTWHDQGNTFVVSHDLWVLFCVVGKVACTSCMRVLLQLTDNPAAELLTAADRASVHATYRFYLQPMSSQKASQLSRSPFKDYYKFMFVREPLERLVSAYRDKMFRSYEYMSLRQYIVNRIRQHASQKYLLMFS